MQLLMTALGSYGDVLPFVGLGAAMKQRGHRPTVISNPHFQEVIESAGLKFLPLGTTEEYDELARHKDLWHPIRGPLLVLRTGMVETLRPIYELISEHYQPGETVLVAHALDVASRVFQEKNDAPLASVHLAPVMLRSFFQSPRMIGMLMSDWTPRWLRRGQYWLADHLLDRLVGRELNSLRTELGLPRAAGILRDWYFSPQLVLGLFPEWFAPSQPDWPPNTRLTGFPLWDQSATTPLPAEVDQYLQNGEPPIVFAPGSAMTDGGWFFSAAADACQRLNRRGVFVTKYPEQLPRDLPSCVQYFDFVPFSQLLPRAAALVHHGGIGTCAQGLAAGIPHVVMPMAYDQLDNATRLKRLGVARTVRRKKFRGPTVAKALSELLDEHSIHQACSHCAEQFDTPRALTASCEALEGLISSVGK